MAANKPIAKKFQFQIPRTCELSLLHLEKQIISPPQYLTLMKENIIA